MLAGEILAMTCIISRYMNSTLPFYKTGHLRYSIFRWYRDQHMYMTGLKMALQNLTLFLGCEVLEC